MDYDQFIQRLTRLSGDDLARLAVRIREGHNLDGDDLAWWKATVAVDQSLRRHRLTSRSALAARAASEAIRAVARRSGLDPDAPEVVATARAAGEAARALVAKEPSVDPCYFFEGWDPLLTLPSWAPCAPPAIAA